MALDYQKQFDVQRQRASQQENALVQNQRDALNRRLAAMGGGPGGAAIKLEQQIGDESAQRLQQANEGINAAQSAEEARTRDVQQARDFARSEREAGQSFQQSNLNKQQELALAGLTGKYQGQDTAAAQQQAFANRMAQDQFDYAKSEGQKEYEYAAKTNAISLMNNLKQSGYTPKQIGEMLKSVGLYDLGIPGFSPQDIEGITTPGAQPWQNLTPQQTSQGLGAAAAASLKRRAGQ